MEGQAADVLERITDGFLALDRRGRLVYANRGAERILRRERGELLGQRVWEVFPGTLESHALSRYRRAVEEQVTVHFEQHSPAEGRHFAVHLYPAPEGASVYFRDVTAQKATEAALRASEEQFRQIAEHVREVLYLATPDAEEVLYVSPTYEEIWGAPREGLLDDAGAWIEAVHPADRERVRAAVPRMKEGTYEVEYRIVRPDGTTRWILDRAFPVRNERGEVYRIVGIAEDVTAEKEREVERERLLAAEQGARREAEAAARLREEVLAIVSHDLKNPLHSIRLSATALRDLPLPEEKRARFVDGILTATERMARLIQGLLDTSRLEAGQGLPVEPRPVEAAALLGDACTLFHPQIEEKKIRLECAGADAPAVRADPDRVLQVFWNLLGNAVKFTPAGGRVELRARPEGAQRVRFSVTDSGPGVPPEHLERLFDPYWQEKRTARLGTGLGLPISRAIVEAHGGEIWVESRLGEGTTFHFTLPAAAGEAA